jgi:hypothetical protein
MSVGFINRIKIFTFLSLMSSKKKPVLKSSKPFLIQGTVYFLADFCPGLGLKKKSSYLKNRLIFLIIKLKGSQKSGPWQCALFLIPRSFHNGGALNYSTAPHRSKTTLISNGVFCLLESKILSIGQTLLYSLDKNIFFFNFKNNFFLCC